VVRPPLKVRQMVQEEGFFKRVGDFFKGIGEFFASWLLSCKSGGFITGCLAVYWH
jgi:hypothetical protein